VGCHKSKRILTLDIWQVGVGFCAFCSSPRGLAFYYSIDPEQNAAAKVCTRDYEKDTAWHVGYFRGGEERTGGGMLQTKQLPWGDAFAL